jgi:SP family myo-inositol transporter-like MFS transporter 13
MAFSFRLWELIIGRFIAGLGIGIASMTVPVYIAEVAPSSIRGALVSADVLLITGGQFVSYGVDLALANHKDNWRWMLGVSAIPGIVQFIGMFFLPESPRWLISERPERKQEAVSVLRRIRGSDDLVTEEVKEIELSIQEEKRGGVVGCWDYQWISNPILRRALVVSVGLQVRLLSSFILPSSFSYFLSLDTHNISLLFRSFNNWQVSTL